MPQPVLHSCHKWFASSQNGKLPVEDREVRVYALACSPRATPLFVAHGTRMVPLVETETKPRLGPATPMLALDVTTGYGPELFFSAATQSAPVISM